VRELPWFKRIAEFKLLRARQESTARSERLVGLIV